MNITICALKIEIEIKKDFTEKYKQVFKDRFTRFLKSQHYGLFVYLIFTFIPPFFFFFEGGGDILKTFPSKAYDSI